MRRSIFVPLCRFVCISVVGFAAVSSSTGCGGEDAKAPVGGHCVDDSDCVTTLCVASTCLDPLLDDDSDGLVNLLEDQLGSSPTNADTDGDGVFDGDEVTDQQAAIDTDGDGANDIVESRTVDSDHDCIPDEYDPTNDVPSTDLSPLQDLVCRTGGVCTAQRGVLTVSCQNGTATCLYDRVTGFADPEVACDGIDENCDGVTDEGFPVGCRDDDYDHDGIADGDDVCPEVADGDQADVDRDGIGDACVDRYALAFAPAPPELVVAGAALDVAGIVVRRAPVDGAPPPPRLRGRVTLLSTAGGDAPIGATDVDANAFVFRAIALTVAGTERLVLSSTLGRTESGAIAVRAAVTAEVTLSAPTTVGARPRRRSWGSGAGGLCVGGQAVADAGGQLAVWHGGPVVSDRADDAARGVDGEVASQRPEERRRGDDHEVLVAVCDTPRVEHIGKLAGERVDGRLVGVGVTFEAAMRAAAELAGGAAVAGDQLAHWQPALGVDMRFDRRELFERRVGLEQVRAARIGNQDPVDVLGLVLMVAHGGSCGMRSR